MSSPKHRRNPMSLPAWAMTLAIAVAPGAAALGQTLDPGSAHGPTDDAAPRISAELRLRRALHRGPLSPPRALAGEASQIDVWVGLSRPITEADAETLAASGLTLHRTASGALGRGAVHRGTLGWPDLDRIAAHPLVRRLEPARPLVTLSPLETIGRQQGTAAAHLRPDDGLTGDGIVVAAIDSPIDPAHPHFFFADAGVYPWADLDGDGAFGRGDGVDIDGEIAPLIVFDGGYIDPLVGEDWQNLDGRLDPGLDWLFADVDGDGRRGVGAGQGYGDDDPALGEPLFVADDTDGDGRLDADERLFRLGTSKIRQTTIGGQTWTRGRDLAEAVDAARRQDAMHGTGVASILLGGQPGFHRRVGLAPGAEYVGYSNLPEGATPFADAAEHGAVLMLHEWSQPAGQPGDGSSLFEQAMDEARADGMLQVCPLGNLNGAGKQIESIVDADALGRLEFEVGDGFFDGQARRAYATVLMHVAWVGGQRPQSARWILPDETAVEIRLDGEPQELPDRMASAVQTERTARGTWWMLIYLWHQNGPGNSLMQGRWALEIGDFAPGVTLHGRLTDEHSGWSEGVGWVGATDDLTSLTYPSTADSAIGVAAYGGRVAMDGQFGGGVGELRAYSGRGPRIDGARAVDIAAPDDPLAALASSALPEFPLGHSGLFIPFGGTSGAGPHVAAAVALYAEQHPQWSADEIEDHLLGAADGDGLVPDVGPLPNDGWGFGKLRVHHGLYGAPAPEDNRPPEVDGLRFADGAVEVIAASDPDGDAMRFRIDLDYDGEWDGPWQAAPRLAVPEGRYAPGEAFDVRVAIRDVRGAETARVAAFTLSAPEPDAAVEVDAGAPDAGVEGDGGVVIVGADAGVVIIEGDGGVVIVGGDSGGGGGGSGGLIGCRAQPGGAPGGGWWLLAPLAIAGARRRR